VALVKNRSPEEIYRHHRHDEKIRELGTTLAEISSVLQLLVTANIVPSSHDSFHPDDEGDTFP
jgi:hypothetical protein